MDKETDEITTNIPDMLEIVAGAIESGAAISELSSQLGFVSFFALIPTLCEIINTLCNTTYSILTIYRRGNLVFKAYQDNRQQSSCLDKQN